MYRIDMDVTATGPLFNGQARTLLHEWEQAAVWEVAKEGRGDLGVQFIKVFKHPTGYYESRVRAERVKDFALIHDQRVKYGPWLEGTGSRNYPVTRFKGYWSFKIVARRLQQKAAVIAQQHLGPFLARMNGH